MAIYGKLSVKTAPTSEPVSLTEAKLALRIDSEDHDSLVENLIKAARQFVEIYCRRSLINTTYEMYLHTFGGAQIELLRPPIVSVSGVYYRSGTTAAWTTLAASQYHVDIYADPPIIEAEDSWPTISADQPNHVKIEYVAGYGTDPEDVPEPIRQGIISIVGDMYENPTRHVEMPNGLHLNPTAAMLLYAYRRQIL